MSFFEFEIEGLKKLFPHKKANIEKDFDAEELEAISSLRLLRYSAHLYLGELSCLCHMIV